MLQRRRATDATQVRKRGRCGRRRHEAMRDSPCLQRRGSPHTLCFVMVARLNLRALLFALPLIP
jgi:hypothetical protein